MDILSVPSSILSGDASYSVKLGATIRSPLFRSAILYLVLFRLEKDSSEFTDLCSAELCLRVYGGPIELRP